MSRGRHAPATDGYQNCAECGERKHATAYGAALGETGYARGRLRGKLTVCRECIANTVPAAEGEQSCHKCGEVKPATEFPVHRSYRGKRGRLRGRLGYCRDCERVRRPAHPGIPITLQQRAQMERERDGRCDIGRHRIRKRPVVDHDHESGKVCGILCDNHNKGIGHFGHDPDRMRAAIEYIDTYRPNAPLMPRSGTNVHAGLVVAVLKAQGGRCAICRTKRFDRKRPCLDHDHDTGMVRGVLCLNCNLGLGLFKDDIDALLAAADYCERTRG